MKDPRDVIIAPVVSEKAYQATEQKNAYTFVVAGSASKPEIADAVEAIFPGAKVGKVNTLNRKGKRYRVRKSNKVRTKPQTKRAIVTLSDGEIDVFGS